MDKEAKEDYPVMDDEFDSPMNGKPQFRSEEQSARDTRVRPNTSLQGESSSNILPGNYRTNHQSPLIETFDLNNFYPFDNAPVALFSGKDSNKESYRYRYTCPKEIFECVGTYLKNEPSVSACISNQMCTEPYHIISKSVCNHNHGYWTKRAEAHGPMLGNEMYVTFCESHSNFKSCFPYKTNYLVQEDLAVSKEHCNETLASGYSYFNYYGHNLIERENYISLKEYCSTDTPSSSYKHYYQVEVPELNLPHEPYTTVCLSNSACNPRHSCTNDACAKAHDSTKRRQIYVLHSSERSHMSKTSYRQINLSMLVASVLASLRRNRYVTYYRSQNILKQSTCQASRGPCVSGHRVRKYSRPRHKSKYGSRWTSFRIQSSAALKKARALHLKRNSARKRRCKKYFPIKSPKTTGTTTYRRSFTTDQVRNIIYKPQVFFENNASADTPKESCNNIHNKLQANNANNIRCGTEICEKTSYKWTNVTRVESSIKSNQAANFIAIICLICALLVVSRGWMIDDLRNYIKLGRNTMCYFSPQNCSVHKRKSEQQASNIKRRRFITSTEFDSCIINLKFEQAVLRKTPSFLKLLHSHTFAIYAYPLVLQSLSEYAERVASSHNMNNADGMNVELCRLLTFRNWQGTVSCMTLARLGFYYNEDEVICFSCNMRLNEWTNDTKPEVSHNNISPNCKMVTANDPNNIPASFWPDRYVRESQSLEVRLSDGLTETDGSVIENTLVSHGEAACGSDPKSADGNCTDCLRNGQMHSSFTLSRYSSRCTDDTFCDGGSPCVESNLMDVIFPPERRNPTTTEIDKCESSHINVDSSSGQDHFFSEIQMNDKTLGIMSDQAKYIRYAPLANRITTFSSWPKDKVQTPEAISKAGFFYAGISDCVKCFFCGGGLRNWEPEDDPWTEHARWFPTCAYVVQCKGHTFVNSVNDGQPDNIPVDSASYISFDGRSSTADNNNSREKKALEENRQLKGKVLCSKCKENPSNILYLPCGHLNMCHVCDANEINCITCNNLSLKKVRVYMS